MGIRTAYVVLLLVLALVKLLFKFLSRSGLMPTEGENDISRIHHYALYSSTIGLGKYEPESVQGKSWCATLLYRPDEIPCTPVMGGLFESYTARLARVYVCIGKKEDKGKVPVYRITSSYSCCWDSSTVFLLYSASLLIPACHPSQPSLFSPPHFLKKTPPLSMSFQC